MTEAVIYDRGYRAYEGELLGRRATRRAIVKDGVRRILGLRRKTRRKVIPWGLLAIGMLMAAIVIGLHFAAGSIAGGVREGLPSYPNLFDLYSRIALLFIAITGPELIGPDRAQGVLSVYFSRPLTVADYLRAKLSAYRWVTMGIYLVPQLALHLGLAALSDDGFFTYLGGNLDVLWQVPFVALCYVAIHGGVLAVISSHVDRTGFGAAAFIGVIVAGNNLAGVLSRAGFPGARLLALLALDSHPRYVRDWVFDVDLGEYAPEAAGFGPGISLLVVAIVAVGGAAWMYRRYRRLA